MATRSPRARLLAGTVVGLVSFALVAPAAQAAPGDATAPTTGAGAPSVAAPPLDAAGSGGDDAVAETSPDAEPVTPQTEDAEFVAEDAIDADGEAVDEPAPSPEDASAGPGTEDDDVEAEQPVVATSDVAGFGVVGVTWSGDLDDTVVVEVRTAESADTAADVDAGWSAWEEVQAEPSPDGTLDGTEPVVVGDVAQVQARVSGPSASAVRDLTLSVIDPGTSAADDDVPVPPATDAPHGTAVAAAAPSRPSISSRAAWGADERMMTWSTRQGDVKAATLHHTAGTNSYSKSQVPGIIRGIYAYHAKTRGWGDIGYNFLVDKYGRVWEGRAGGITRETIGGHARGYNTNSTGVSVLGNYDTTRPTTASVDAVVRLIAWKLALHGVRATGTTSIGGTTEYRIHGHRDVASTACPGRYLYPKLGEIRRRAQALQDIANRPSLASGTVVSNPDGDVALVEKGRRHAASCSTLAEYGKSCRKTVRLTSAQWRSFTDGGRLQRTVRTTDGRLYYVVNGKKREAFDTASLRRAGKSTTTVTMNVAAISSLSYGNPIVRPGVIVVNRSNGNHRLVVSGRKHAYIGSALRARTPLGGLDSGRLDGQSVARMPQVGRTTGVVKQSSGRQYLVSTRGMVRIDGGGRLRSSSDTQQWGGVLASDIRKATSGRPRLVVVRVRGSEQRYVVRDGLLRPVSATRARQLNGGRTPTVHVILEITKKELPVGSRL
ncbi:N-acetylmuramoyl-L-alanine amidase [Isoptericola jiangsuensis]|uniref:N-acetylmuramoyl-L-alanine amidase n=1 Tax=Isoptericola jiangsuensis TaxID=548579 RepID=UPI003AB0D3EB